MATAVPVISASEGIPPPSPRRLRGEDLLATDIEMIGPASLSHGKWGWAMTSVLGVYARDCEEGEGPAVCAGRPTYTKQDGSNKRIYYSASSDHWFIGGTVGKPGGVACARGDAMTPDQLCQGTWEVKAGGWQAVAELTACRVTAM